MANWQVISLDTTTPQLRAPGTGDGYSFNSGSTQLGVWTTTGLGIGTASPAAKLHVAGNTKTGTGAASNSATLMVNNLTGSATGIQLFQDGIESWIMGMPANSAGLAWSASGAEQMRLTSTGLGIGTASPSAKLSISGGNIFVDNANGSLIVRNADATNQQQIRLRMASNDGVLDVTRASGTAPNLIIGTEATERARITSGGNLLVNKTTAEYGKFEVSSSEIWVSYFVNTKTSGDTRGLRVSYSGISPNSTADWFLFCEDSTAQRASIRSNGGLANYQSNNVDLSDARTKKDITPAASMWDKVGALEIVTYKYNDQTHDDVNLGVIAQQVESVEPVWVDADGFGETPEDGVPLKTVYTKDITFAAIKALQEAMARIEKLEAEVSALKGA